MNIEVEDTLKSFQCDIVNKSLDDEIRFLVIVASRQIGKSMSLRVVSLLWACERKVDIGYCTLTNKLSKKFFKEMTNNLPTQIIKKANATELIIEFSNGSTLQYHSIEAIDKVRGFTFDYLIIDECAFAKEVTPNGQNIWQNILSPTLDARNGKAVFVSTPFGKKGLFFEAYQRAKTKRKGYDIVEATIYDDETKTSEWIEEKKSEISEKAFRQEYECEFIDDGVSFFTNYRDLFIVEKWTHIRCWCGLDFSSVGEDNTILTAVNEKGETKQWNITGSLDDKYSEIAKILNSLNFSCCLYETNSIGEVMANEIKKQLRRRSDFKPFTTTNKSKDDIINHLDLSINKNELLFLSSDEELKSEFDTFTFSINPRTKNVKYEAMEGFHDDRIMSLAFADYARTLNKMTNVSVKIHN